MTISTRETIIGRIKTAPKRSKIAIFKIEQNRRVFLDAVFDNTAITQRRIKFGDTDYLGSFYGDSGAYEANLVMRYL